MLPGLTAPNEPSQAAAAAVAQVPFIRATTRHEEPAFDTGSNIITTSSQQLGPYDVPAHGFIRGVGLLVECTGAVINTGVAAADFPYNIIQEVTITDTNGYPVVYPLSGYQLYLANLFGGYRGNNNPVLHPNFAVGTSDLNPTFMLRLPIEITPWDGFGALSNQSQSAPFRVRITLAPSASLIASGSVTTEPTVRIRGYLESYSPVPATDLTGRNQQQAPPGHGATQFWSVTTPTVSAGRQQVQLSRVGNLIRTLILVNRTAAGARSATVEPDDLTLMWDSRQVFATKPDSIIRREMYEAFGLTTIPTGVLAFSFADDQDGSAGYESRHMWLPTVPTTRLEIDGTFGAAGTLEVLTNDVAVTALGR